MTPFHENGGVPVPVAEREEGCRRMLNLLNAEIQLRHADGQVLWLVCGLEHGEQNGNPHLQLVYQVRILVPSDTTEDKKRSSAKKKAWLKENIAVEGVDVKVSYKTVKSGNEAYLIGYCVKDQGLAHSVLLIVGLSDTRVQDAFNYETMVIFVPFLMWFPAP